MRYFWNEEWRCLMVPLASAHHIRLIPIEYWNVPKVNKLEAARQLIVALRCYRTTFGKDEDIHENDDHDNVNTHAHKKTSARRPNAFYLILKIFGAFVSTKLVVICLFAHSIF